VTVTVTDEDGQSAVDSFIRGITNAAPVISSLTGPTLLDEGELATFSASAMDPGADDVDRLVFTWNFGDGSAPVIGSEVQHAFPDDETGAAPEMNQYIVTLTVTDGEGGNAQQTRTVTVRNATPILLPVAVPGVVEGSLVRLTALFTDAGFDVDGDSGVAPSETFTYEVDWGDGSPAATGNASATTPGGVGQVTEGTFKPTHTYADAGTYAVTVAVINDEGARSEQRINLTVAGAAPEFDGIPDRTVDEGTVIDLFNSDVFAFGGFSDAGFRPDSAFLYEVDFGDGSSVRRGFSVSLPGGEPHPLAGPQASDPDFVVIEGSAGVPTRATIPSVLHAWQDDGIYTVTVRITDDDLLTTTETFDVTVSNVGPTVSFVMPDVDLEVGERFEIDGTFSDVGDDDLEDVDVEVRFRPAGSMSDDDFEFRRATLAGTTFQFSRVFTEAGSFELQLTADDQDPGGAASQTFMLTVADMTGPEAVITADEPSPTAAGVIPVSVTFDEGVAGFDFSDLTITGGTVGNFVAIDSQTFEFDLTPTTSGRVTVDIAADGATDLAGNGNSAATFGIVTMPRLSISDVTRLETDPMDGSTGFEFDVTRDHNIGDVSVDVLPEAGTATANRDFDLTGMQTIEFLNAGELTQRVSIRVFDDDLVEGDETFFVNLLNPTGGVLLDGQGIGTILNDDSAGLSLTFAPASFYEEGVTTGFVRRNSGDVSADLEIALSSALPLRASVPTTVTIPAGGRTVSFSVTGFDDGLPTGDDEVTISATADGFADGIGDVTLLETPVDGFSFHDGEFAAFATDGQLILDTDPATGFVTFNGELTNVDRSAVKRLIANGTAADDFIDLSGIRDGELDGLLSPIMVLAGDGDDTVYGSSTADVISAGVGNDFVVGAMGDDTIDGESGDDSLMGGGGDDDISGGGDDDIVSGHSGRDRLKGDAGNDRVSGSRGDDTLDGGTGDDILLGGRDNDDLHGGDDDDVLDGQGGVNTLAGEGGNDLLVSDQIAQRLDGGDGDDTLVGSSQGDTLNGGGGNDSIDGLGGNDRIEGGGGNDSMSGGDGDDTVFGNSGDDVLSGEAGADILFGGSGRDRVDGGDGNDIVRGQGGAGDSVIGGAGTDTLDGGSGGDFLIASGQRFSEGLRILLTPGELRFESLTGVLLEADTLIGLERAALTGSGFDDVMVTENATPGFTEATMLGAGGDDELIGSNMAEQLLGGSGNDTIRGAGGFDRILGASGSDVLDGGAGNDLVRGQQGADSLTGGDGNDTLDGGTENDTLRGQAGDDVLSGGDGLDGLAGGPGQDTLNGGDGNDLLFGGTGDDELSGGLGLDQVFGNDGADAISGDDGVDTLVGNSGDGTADPADTFDDPTEIDNAFAIDPLPMWADIV
jgi:Ca2+-binding RTX toxin-like protein